MLETLRELTFVGFGTADFTEEKLRTLFEDLVKRGEITEKDSREMLADWMNLAKVREGRVQRQIETSVRKVLERLDLPQRRDLDSLAARVGELDERVKRATWATKYPD